MHVALASCLTLPEPDPDESPLLSALRARGLAAQTVAWDDPHADFGAAQLTLLRATWNYSEQPERFLAWVHDVSRRSQLWNPAEVVRWNIHKRYLLALAERGVPIVPTQWVAQGAVESLQAIRERRGFDEVVIKPAISAGSRGTRRFDAASLEEGEAHLRNLLACGDALVQPYLPAVETRGEHSLIWIDGALTHAVRKSPRFSEDSEQIAPLHALTASERALAERTLAALGMPIFYARVDVVPDAAGEPLLMELELIEPSLYFAHSERALARFVDGVCSRLGPVG